MASVALAPGALAEETTSPYATGGMVTCIDNEDPFRISYIHVFTNTEEVATFASTGKRALQVRYLVVGAGGAGGNRHSSSCYGGGGGGGGGVCEKEKILFPANFSWQILVGKGSASYSETAGASSISNGVVEVETVPGGGNGGSYDGNKNSCVPTSGAAGGGGVVKTDNGEDSKDGANGEYPSVTLMDTPENAPFKGGTARSSSQSRAGAAGGGAGSAANNVPSAHPTDFGAAGEGIRSDITGEILYYGSGGGGGNGFKTGLLAAGGFGGTRAGDGGRHEIVDNVDGSATTNYVAATSAVANSGSGGGGALGYGKGAVVSYDPGSGADGVVVIRYDVAKSPCPCIGGVVTRTLKSGGKYTYVHTFTNTEEVAWFANDSDVTIENLRYLVVGGGGAGGDRNSSSFYGGGGGGGGGVCEKAGIALSAGTLWQVLVGKGATSYSETAGTSSISNGVADVETVPGGGNGGSQYSNATSGAAGGGWIRITYSSDNRTYIGGDGTYASSIFGVTNGPFNAATGTGSLRRGGGGAGAGAASVRTNSKGGEGLTSDITGESLVYGSGGGGGSGNTTIDTGIGDVGGTRAGNGGVFTVTDNGDGSATTNAVAATSAVANSGGGGGGALGLKIDGDYNGNGSGADGIVVIRYDYNENPVGFIMSFR